MRLGKGSTGVTLRVVIERRTIVDRIAHSIMTATLGHAYSSECEIASIYVGCNDADMMAFEGVRDVEILSLHERIVSDTISDAGLYHLRGMTCLKRLSVNPTLPGKVFPITNVGLRYLHRDPDTWNTSTLVARKSRMREIDELHR